MPTPQLTDNDFAILGVPQQFEQDLNLLTQRWKELQTQMHPDRFAIEGTAAQRMATQWSIRINEAFGNLKDPVKRASTLCELAGFPVELETNTAMPGSFLMQQMQWREALEDARTADQVDEVFKEVRQEQQLLLASLSWLIDEKGDYPEAVQKVRALVFLKRFLDGIQVKLDDLED